MHSFKKEEINFKLKQKNHHHVTLLVWISLNFSLCIHPDYILCGHKALIGKFLLVKLHWHVHVKGSIEECHEFVLASPVVSHMFCLSYLDSFKDGR